jgi:acetylornithine deacetylase
MAADDLQRELSLLESLVAFDTTSRNPNVALVDWAEALLTRAGASCERIADHAAGKANLLAVVGPRVADGIVLAGHTDVVPVDGQDWTSDPWQLTRRGTRLHGRGTADMKGFLALMLAAAERAATVDLRRPLVLALTYDEEVGCLGAPALVERLGRALPSPQLVLIGEPTSMRVVTAHKGLRLFDVEVLGKEAHSCNAGTGLGVSANDAAVELMALVRSIAGEETRRAASSPFTPPGTTLTIGRMQGGTAVNILARRCTFTWDLRAPNPADAERIEARFRAAAADVETRLRRIDPGCGVKITRRADVPGLTADPDGPARRVAAELSGDAGCGSVSFVAEAGLFAAGGLSAVLCGPGSIDQAHVADEWIELAELQAGRRLVDGVIARLATSGLYSG